MGLQDRLRILRDSISFPSLIDWYKVHHGSGRKLLGLGVGFTVSVRLLNEAWRLELNLGAFAEKGWRLLIHFFGLQASFNAT